MVHYRRLDLLQQASLLLLLTLGLPQPIRAQRPHPHSQTVVVVLDDSGSMDNNMRTNAGRVLRINAAKQALSQVLSRLPSETRVGVLALNSQAAGTHWILPIGPLADNAWRSRIDSIKAAGGTPLGEYLKQGADALLSARSASPYGSYRLLVVTDGEASDQVLVDSYLPEILARGVTVDVIGVDMDGEHSLALRAHSYRRANDPAALEQALVEVFAETSVDDQAAATDFELLAGLPDEFAVEAVKVLTQRNDQPIVGAAIDPQTRETTNSKRSGGAKIATTALSGLLCCLCPLAIVAVTLVGFLMLVRKRK